MKPQLLQIHQVDPAAIRAELLAGLQATPATIAPKYLYDALGSSLFEAICRLPWYRVTRIEQSLLSTYAAEIFGRLPPISLARPVPRARGRFRFPLLRRALRRCAQPGGTPAMAGPHVLVCGLPLL